MEDLELKFGIRIQLFQALLAQSGLLLNLLLLISIKTAQIISEMLCVQTLKSLTPTTLVPLVQRNIGSDKLLKDQ